MWYTHDKIIFNNYISDCKYLIFSQHCKLLFGHDKDNLLKDNHNKIICNAHNKRLPKQKTYLKKITPIIHSFLFI